MGALGKQAKVRLGGEHQKMMGRMCIKCMKKESVYSGTGPQLGQTLAAGVWGASGAPSAPRCVV